VININRELGQKAILPRDKALWKFSPLAATTSPPRKLLG
jgi:hypothetical protein